jgi:hypothetical protein
MDVEVTEPDRKTLLREAVANVGRTELKAALDLAIQSGVQRPKAVHNALLALRRHHDPVPYVARPQYRPTLPYLAAALSDECLARTIEALGDDSDDPSREQLLDALDTVRSDFSDPVIAVMLAGVALDEMPSSDLCAELLTTDPRYGLASETAGPVEPPPVDHQAESREGAGPST